MTLVLASRSAARAAMLQAAGVRFTVRSARVDEDAAKASLRAQGMRARDLADALAELKAARGADDGDVVLGCDQTLELDDGTMLDKPGAELAEQLRALSGRRHRLHSAAVIVEDGRPTWRALETATLTMRPLSEPFIAGYVASEGQAGACAGGYRIEGPGIQLFSRIEGSWFAILGLPLLPLLDRLRLTGALPT